MRTSHKRVIFGGAAAIVTAAAAFSFAGPAAAQGPSAVDREILAQQQRTQAAVRAAMRVGSGTVQQRQGAPTAQPMFGHQTPREAFPSNLQRGGGYPYGPQGYYVAPGYAFPPLSSSGNVYTSPSSLPPIQGQGYYTLPDGSVVRPAGSNYGGGNHGGGYYNGNPAGALPLGTGSLTPYPTDQRAPVHPDAPYTRGPIDGTYQGKGSVSNVLIFPGYRNTLVVNQTVVSPFGAWYGCPGYIDSRFVVTTPWVYASGVSVGTVSAWSDADPFIGADAARARELRTALNDLTRFWEGGDIRGLRRHLPGGGENIAVFHNGKYLYALGRNDFASVSSDVVDAVDTVSFRFSRVEKRDDGLVDATARHQYRVRETGETRTGSVRYSLLYQDGTYFVSAVSIGSGG